MSTAIVIFAILALLEDNKGIAAPVLAVLALVASC